MVRSISIHAPRVGRDVLFHLGEVVQGISIHAPRVGRDGLGFDVGPIHSNFNPRAPCGARPVLCIALYTSCLFQSTRPVWGATFASSTAVFHRLISIHAPRVGRDFDPLYLMFDGDLFQSTRPVWGATLRVSVLHIEQPVFQSTRPVWGATCAIIGCVIETRNFNPRAPCGARRIRPRPSSARTTRFQSTRPVWGATILRDHCGIY